jgi:glycerol-3-phosphate dehydrogenase
LDAQLRGLRTLLLEASDFGSGTSTASTKLIHGGLRYLQQAVTSFDVGQYRVVRRALSERQLMMRNAPHLARTCHFMVPCFNRWDAAYYDIGLKFYDWLSGSASLSPSYFVNRAESLARMPNLSDEGLFGAIVYSDGQFDDARYNLALVQSFTEAGGDALNYARVAGFTKDSSGRLVGAIVRDEESQQSFRVTAQSFVNATGPYSDSIRQLATPGVEERLTHSKGVHILLPLPEHFGECALLIPRTEDERVVFAIPWLGRLLVGTTETEWNPGEELIATRDEAEYLLRHLNRYLARGFQLSDIVSVTAGLRPLVRMRHSNDTRRIIRDFEVELDPQSGLISVLGGKWTVYRAMAEAAIDIVQKAVEGRISECRTRNYRLAGSEHEPEHTACRLTQKFGDRAALILDLVQRDPSLGGPLVEGAPQILAEVVYCVRDEMAVRIEDVLGRRLGLQFFDWNLAVRAAPAVGRILATELGWSPARTRVETDQYVERILHLQRAVRANLASEEIIQSGKN